MMRKFDTNIESWRGDKYRIYYADIRDLSSKGKPDPIQEESPLFDPELRDNKTSISPAPLAGDLPDEIYQGGYR